MEPKDERKKGQGAKEQRLADQLRSNLLKRKALAKERQKRHDTPPGGPGKEPEA